MSIQVTEENRRLLSKSGFIQYQTGKSLDYGILSKFINNLINLRLKGTREGVEYAKAKLLELQKDITKIEKEIQTTVEFIRKKESSPATPSKKKTKEK